MFYSHRLECGTETFLNWPQAAQEFTAAPQHFLYFLPLPQGQGSLRPILGSLRRMVFEWPQPE